MSDYDIKKKLVNEDQIKAVYSPNADKNAG